MSAEYEEVVDADEVCASCGKAEVDDVKLKICACKLVKYCTIGCQKNHRPQHEEKCKKRKTELRDKDLFTQPDGSHLGECPICCLPQSIDTSKSTVMPCCSKLLICKGCSYANQMREFEAGLEQRCAFWLPKSQEEKDKYVMNRVKKNCPVAMQQTGARRYRGEGDYGSALEHFTKSAELDDADAHHALSLMYVDGHGVEKDMEKVVYHMEEAAIAGHPDARYNLGVVEKKSGGFERARKHFIIAANLGFQDSLNQLRILYADGNASKEEYFDALRAYQEAVDATKSVEREEAEAVQELRRRVFSNVLKIFLRHYLLQRKVQRGRQQKHITLRKGSNRSIS